MKNIYILPTERESNLFIGDLSGKLHYNYSIEKGNSVNQFIYITNDEVIKEGDYCINLHCIPLWNGKNKYNPVEKACKNAEENYKSNMSYNDGKTFLRDNLFKIVLTNDPNLTVVQQLTEEQLQEFVSNPVDYVGVEDIYNQELNCCNEKCEFGCHSFFECKNVDENDLSRSYKVKFPPKDLEINKPIKIESLEDIVRYFQTRTPNNREIEESVAQLFLDTTGNELWERHGEGAYSYTEEYVNWLEDKLVEYIKKTL